MEIFDLDPKSMFDSTPRKKKKYILLLYSMSQEHEERIRMLEKAVQKTLKNFILVRLDDPDEGLKAIIVKNIEIIIIDSSLFNNDSISIEYAIECKKRKKCPILFIASEPQKLISEYRDKLFMYEEFDSYFNTPIDFTEFTKKLLQVSTSKGRAAKRFSLNIPISMYRLNNDKKYSVTLSDISLVGFGVSHRYEDIFSRGEQVQIKVPLAQFKIFHAQYGEFLPLSGKLRRISISGDHLGFSIEFITPLQVEVLCQILSIMNYKAKLTKFGEKTAEDSAAKKILLSDMM
ncbi:MAG: PilZ domain-containing protein [Bdellovibrionota bacterium]